MKTILISTHLLAAGLGLGVGAAYVDNAEQRRAFAAGAISGIEIAHLDAGLQRQGAPLSTHDIIKIINNEWIKFNK